jgi:uncharacterized protein (DUF2225 family)
LVACEARATTVSAIQVECPVCEAKIDALSLMSTNNFGGCDSDLLQRAIGTQPITILPIVCTRCYYAGYQSDFGEDVTIPKELKSQLEEQLKPPLAIRHTGKSHQVPCWVRYDLIAQRYALEGQSAENLANCYLRCSWSVRLTADLSATAVPGDAMQRVIGLVTDQEGGHAERPANRAEHEVDAGIRLSQYLDTADENEKRLVGLVAVTLLRTHGENTLVEELLGRLKTVIPAPEFATISRQLQESIRLEQAYQEKALAVFQKLAEDDTQEHRRVFLYLCGELNRRLGRFQKAVAWYDRAGELQEPAWITELVDRQRGIAVASKPALDSRESIE